MSKSAVLVTGGAGFIGSAVADALVRAGRHVVIIDNLSTGEKKALPPGVEFHSLSIDDVEALSALMRSSGVTAVFHFAAFIKVPESVENPERYFKNNRDGTYSLLQAMQRANVNHFLFSSTAAVYGQVTKPLVTETDPVLPINPYGESKLQAEEIVRAHGEKHPAFRYLTFRYFNVAGSDIARGIGPRDPAPTQLIRRACQAALGIIPTLTVFGDDYPTPDGTCIRDYIHVKDLAAALVRGLEAMERQPMREIMNIGYGRGRSVLEVIRSLENIIGRPVPHEIKARREGDPTAVVADPSKAVRMLGIEWRHDSIEEICRDSLNWEKTIHDLSPDLTK